MKTSLSDSLKRWMACASVACGLSLSSQAAPMPYSVDPNTLHLWHFDEVQNPNNVLPVLPPATESSEGLPAIYDLTLTNGAKYVASTLASGMTNTLDSRGIPGALQNGAGAFSIDNLIWYPEDIADPISGAFTIEALVSPDFDPTATNVSRPNMQIISLDNEGATTNRVFQFRLAPGATNQQYSLQFENIGSAAPGSNAPATTTLIDDFNLGIDPIYANTRLLQVTAGSDNVYGWVVSAGSLQINTTNYYGIEQYALTRNDHPLQVGQMLVCDYLRDNLDSQDIGLYVGAATPTRDVRQDYVDVYVRNDNAVYSRGFNGTTELPLVGGGTDGLTLSSLFVARTSTNTFELGYYNEGNRVVMTTRTVNNTNIGNTIGIYADVRASGIRGNVDNLRFATNQVLVPPSSPEVFTALLPTNGINAAVQGAWYHAAVTYNGAENTANNLTLYWTKVTNSPTSASVLQQFRMTNDLGNAEGTTVEADLAVGNEGRDAPGENFQGLVDEVRVSDTARAGNAFHLNGTPYAVDANTKLLYHFDQTTPAGFPTSLLNDAMDEVTVNLLDCDVRNEATFGASAYTGFGTSMLVSPTNGTGNIPLNDAAGAYANTENLPFDPNFGSTNTGFTFEALIRPDFDPASTNEYMQIVCGDGNDGASDARGWQWKFEQRTNLANPLRLEFIWLAGGETHLYAVVPTAVPHAIVKGKWYHVAVTFNGNTNDASNFKFYWTALDSGDTTANLIATTNLVRSVGGSQINLSVGNENRNFNGNSDAFIGAIDEVRISKVARAANQFLLAPPQPEITKISLNKAAGTVTLTWTSDSASTYAIERSIDLTAPGGGFDTAKTGIAGGASTTTDSVAVSGMGVGYYRVKVE